MRAIGSVGVLVSIIALVASQNAAAAVSGLTRVASGLNGPMFVTAAPGDRSRLFIAEDDRKDVVHLIDER